MDCIDILGRSIGQDIHFVPGPDACTLCVCDNGNPKWCKAVLCSPPQDCKSFRVGNSCCDFICLDDALGKGDTEHDFNADLGLRLIATAITAILSLSLLFFLIHRLRQRKIRGRQNRELSCEEDRSLASIGYIGGSLGYLGDGHFEESPGQFPLWKPAGYFTRSEAPPPYEEAVAAARAEAALSRINPGPSLISAVQTSQHHRTIPVNLATSAALVLPPPPIPELPEEPQPPCYQSISGEGESRIRRNPSGGVPGGAPAAPVVVPLPPAPSVGSTASVPPTTGEEAEDYRSECENCQMSANQRNGEGEYCTDLRTMTLQRKSAQYDDQQPNFYRTSLTLPTQVGKHRVVSGGSCARENWFSSMPESSSSEEDE